MQAGNSSDVLGQSESAPVGPGHGVPSEPIPENVEADGNVDDNDDAFSDTTSITSEQFRGYIENGRKYSTTREGFWAPSDEKRASPLSHPPLLPPPPEPAISHASTSLPGSPRALRAHIANLTPWQHFRAWNKTRSARAEVSANVHKEFESMEASHLMFAILDCQEENPLFRAELGEGVKRVLDAGTGDGSWAMDCADRNPHFLVKGVDLAPPPNNFVPPNCTLEVDDISKPWTWKHKFDLVHIRNLVGSFTEEGWKNVYQNAYDNLNPGGWIEQLEVDSTFISDDNTLPPTSVLAAFNPTMISAASKLGLVCDLASTMPSRLSSAGFINLHTKTYKCPLNTWPRHPVFKDAGRVNNVVWRAGMEGLAMYLLTNVAEPRWSAEEVRAWVARGVVELDRREWHGYHVARRCWAQKPFEDEGKK